MFSERFYLDRETTQLNMFGANNEAIIDSLILFLKSISEEMIPSFAAVYVILLKCVSCQSRSNVLLLYCGSFCFHVSFLFFVSAVVMPKEK